jgi:hypothetical protein
MIAQIINDSISAGWVLVIVSTIAGVLALMILNDIRSSIKAVVNRQNEQEKTLTINTQRTEYAHERLDKIDMAMQKNGN